MKPTNEQQEELKKYLHENLQYRETFAEFYDHILSALETKPDDLPFPDAYKEIIRNDFGEIEDMRRIEDRYSTAIRNEMKRKYWQYIAACFTGPLAGATVLIAVLFYIIIIQPGFNFIVFIELLCAVRIAPGIFKWIRHFKLGYIYKDAKKSVKDNIYLWLDYIPAYAFTLLIILCPAGRKDTWEWFKHINPIIVAVVLLLTSLHTFTYYRLYKDEFKIKAIV